MGGGLPETMFVLLLLVLYTRIQNIPALADNGALGVHNYKLYMSDDYKTCTGTINYHLHKMGTDPFSPRSPIVGQDKGTVVLC
jgi:hypothetical protein